MPRVMIETPAKACQQCGQMMKRPPRLPVPQWDRRRWCSKQCMAIARAPKEQVCERCGKTFTPTFTRKRGHQFCSIPCANIGKPIKGPYRKMREGDRVRTVHRVNKEREIGRPLTPEEVVHHVDENKLNNDPANLEITTNSQHSREHMKGNRHASRSRQ